MSEEKTPWMIAETLTLASATDGKKLVHDEDEIIILLDGQVVVEHQYCGKCRPKKTGLTKQGSYIYIPRGTHHQVKNRMLKRAWYIEVITNFSEPE